MFEWNAWVVGDLEFFRRKGEFFGIGGNRNRYFRVEFDMYLGYMHIFIK